MPRKTKGEKEIEELREFNDQELQEQFSGKPDSNGKKKKVVFILLLILAVFGFVCAYLTFTGATETSAEKIEVEKQKQQQEEIEKVVKQVREHFVLPENELPSVATIVDAQTLINEQPFYHGSIDGDKVLIYLQKQQAILYSPERDIIVNVGPVVVNNQN